MQGVARQGLEGQGVEQAVTVLEGLVLVLAQLLPVGKKEQRGRGSCCVFGCPLQLLVLLRNVSSP